MLHTSSRDDEVVRIPHAADLEMIQKKEKDIR